MDKLKYINNIENLCDIVCHFNVLNNILTKDKNKKISAFDTNIRKK